MYVPNILIPIFLIFLFGEHEKEWVIEFLRELICLLKLCFVFSIVELALSAKPKLFILKASHLDFRFQFHRIYRLSPKSVWLPKLVVYRDLVSLPRQVLLREVFFKQLFSFVSDYKVTNTYEASLTEQSQHLFWVRRRSISDVVW